MDEFREYWELAKKDRKFSPWSNNRTLKERLGEIKKEVDEAEEALEAKDYAHFSEEFGDIFWDLLAVAAIAEEKEIFNIEEVITNSLEKFEKRKPWILNGEKLSEEEEVKRYKENKK